MFVMNATWNHLFLKYSVYLDACFIWWSELVIFLIQICSIYNQICGFFLKSSCLSFLLSNLHLFIFSLIWNRCIQTLMFPLCCWIVNSISSLQIKYYGNISFNNLACQYRVHFQFCIVVDLLVSDTSIKIIIWNNDELISNSLLNYSQTSIWS